MQRPKRSVGWLALAAGAVGVVAFLLAAGTEDGAIDISTGTGTAAGRVTEVSPSATSEDLLPLRLRAGVYRYSTQTLGSEVTTDDGTVLDPARPEPEATWRLEILPNGDFEERGGVGGQEIIRSSREGQQRTMIRGEEAGLGAEPAPADVEAAARAGSSLPAGGPRIEFNPYGASFLLHIEAAQNSDALAAGREAASTEEHVSCGKLTCTSVVFERQVERPPDDAEFYRSLPWGDNNVETSEVVYEPETQIVHSYRTSFNGVTLHRFTLVEAP